MQVTTCTRTLVLRAPPSNTIARSVLHSTTRHFNSRAANTKSFPSIRSSQLFTSTLQARLASTSSPASPSSTSTARPTPSKAPSTTPHLNTTTPTSESAGTTTISRSKLPSSSSPSSLLPWAEYLRLRKVRRRYALVSSIICAGITGSIGFYFISGIDIESINKQLPGWDPLIVLGGMTIATIGLGWLAGPVAGNGAFRLRYSSLGNAFRQREKSFYDRIKARRAEPTGVSAQNPLPDYYGEKIGSIKDYRTWLKDQRAFKKKRETQVREAL